MKSNLNQNTQMPTSSSVMTVKWDGGAGSSTSMLGEDKPEPLQFADLISSFLDKERSAGCGIPKNLTSSFPVAVQSGGPAPSAPFASLTSSFLATEGSGGLTPSWIQLHSWEQSWIASSTRYLHV